MADPRTPYGQILLAFTVGGLLGGICIAMLVLSANGQYSSATFDLLLAIGTVLFAASCILISVAARAFKRQGLPFGGPQP